MLTQKLEDLSESTLNDLVSGRANESQTLEFKRTLPSTLDKDKHEFLKDVCAMANAAGGDIIYGISENEGSSESIFPCADPPDSVTRRLGQLLDSGIEPRLIGVRMHPVDVTGGYCLVVRIPASFAGPHRFLFNGHSKFVVRNSTHTSEMTYGQLRAAFDKGASLSEMARAFVATRRSDITARRTWRPMSEGPLCTAHLVPLSAMASQIQLDVREVDYVKLMFQDWGGASSALNLDGLISYVKDDEKIQAYSQLFRNGAIESVRNAESHFSPKTIPSTTISFFYRDALLKFTDTIKKQGLFGPAIFAASMLNVSGHKLGIDGNSYHRGNLLADRPHLALPDIWIESIECVDDRNVDDFLKPILDIMWQAFGASKCSLYNHAGEWIGTR